MTFKQIRFVTDSTCDLPADVIAKYQIGVVPCFINYGGNSYADDGEEFQRGDFYETLPKIRPLPTTAAPPPGLCERVITETLGDADHVVMICAPANLSGIYNSLRLGASGLPEGRATLIDSGTVSMALGFQVLTAAQVAQETGDLQAVLDAVRAVRENETLLATLATLEYLRHGGRVSWAAASVGGLLQIKPIIEVKDGEVRSAARVRTFNRAIDEMVEMVRQYAPLDRMAVLHANNAEAANGLRERLSDIAPAETYILHVTPVLGVHAGPGALALAPVSKSWRS